MKEENRVEVFNLNYSLFTIHYSSFINYKSKFIKKSYLDE